MSDSGASAGPGWYHAEGDPPGTERYWDGAAWQGEPRQVPTPAPPPPTPPAPGFGSPPPPGGAEPALTGTAPWAANPPPAKKRSVWKLVVGLILGFMLLIGGCTFFLWRAVSGPIDAGNEFLAAVQAEDFPAAWALSDPGCFDNAGPGVLEEAFGPVVIEAYRLTTSNVQLVEGVNTGTTSGEITFEPADTRTIDLFMVERDGWLVCGFDIGPPAGG